MHVKGRKGDRRERAAPLASSFVQVCKCITLSLLPLVRSLALSSFARQEPVLVCLLPTASGLVFLQLQSGCREAGSELQNETPSVSSLSLPLSRVGERGCGVVACVFSLACAFAGFCVCVSASAAAAAAASLYVCAHLSMRVSVAVCVCVCASPAASE